MSQFRLISLICGLFLLIFVSTPVFGDAYFTATPSNGVAPLTVSFADLSVLPDPLAFIYTWDFGDGTFSSDKSPVHEYSAFGEYLVTLNLTSTDPSYQSSEYTLPERIRVYPSSPQARFTWVADQNYVPMKVRFIDQSYSYVAITDWNWTFTVNGTQIANSTDQNPEIQFEFDDIQTFPSHITAELTITDENGETFSVTQNVEVSARLFPLAGFAVVPSNSPGTVTFIDQALVDPIIAGDAPLRYQWEWDFGDESPTTVALYFNQNLEHTYDEPGTYLVTQTVRLMDESLERIIRENTANMYVIVSDSSVPKAAFTWVADQEHVPSKVRFIDQSYSHVAITDWNWTFTANGVQIANSTDQNPEIQFEFDDSRTFPSHISTKLTITDADGETFSVTHNVEISARLFPLAGFAFVHSNPPGTVTFIDQSLVDPIIAGASPLRYQWEWDFGDGTPPSTTSYFNQNLEHTYDKPGAYLVTQTVRLMDESLENCIRENTASMLVIVPDINVPKAAFTWVADQEHVPSKVRFIDQSYSYVTITDWNWTFTANGVQIESSTDQNPEIQFAFDDSRIFPPYITAELTITDASGETFSVTQNVEVSARLFPLAGFAVVHSNPPGTVTFIDQSLVDPIIVGDAPLRYQWEWDFGDGATTVTSYFNQNPEYTYDKPGTYLVTQTVRLMDEALENCIRENAVSMQVVVPDLNVPKAAFTWVADQEHVPSKVRFIDQSYSPITITDWNWTFTANGVQIESSTDQNPEIQFVFDDSRTFPPHITAELTITDAGGETFSVTHNIEISARLFPLAGFAFVHSNPPGTVTFIDQSLVDPIIVGDAPLRYQWEWDFGDGTPPTVTSYFNQNPEHTYDKPGTYLVTQTVRLMDESLENCIRENKFSMYVIIPDLNVPKAAFTWVANQEHVPSKVRFIDQSYSPMTITDWYWTFTANDVQIESSTDQNPEIQFVFDDSRTFPPHITAELTITDANGETFSVTQNVEISARLFPLAGFAVVHSNPPGTVTFIDQSLVDPIIVGDAPLRYQWEWDFGDGSTTVTSYFNQNPEHIYDKPGTYLVTQTVRLMDESLENCIRENKISMQVRIPDLSAPKAAFTWVADQEHVPSKVRFIDQSYSPMTITDWNWTFTANGVQIESSTDQNPEIQFVFDDSRTFPPHITAELTITDASGETFSVTHNVEISARLFPLAGFAFVHSNPPGIVTFIDQTLVDPIIAGDAPLRYQWEWDFGDGTPPIVTSYFSQNPEHTYDEPGTYLVTQTVRLMDESLENCVRENKFSMYVTISDPLPAIAMFTAAPLTGFAPLTVSFTDLSTGDIATWKWSFGDGTAPMYEQHPVHIYNEPGIYTVTLEVFDADGAALDSISKSHLIHVESPLSLSAQFTAAPRVGLPPLATSFTDLSVDAVEWKWDFGDGTISYEQHPLHTYTDEGTYKVVLQVWDLDGKSAMTTEENFIHVSFAPDPIADFAAIPSSGPVPLVVSFVDQTISHGTIDSYFWDFGNGEFSTQKNPTAVYSTPGSYDVTLTVTDQYGTDSCTKLNVVIAETLQVMFVADPPSGLPSLHVSFIDLSTGAPTLWKWDFGDGHSSNEPNPVNIYTEPGTYEVTLTIFDAHGKTSRDTKTIKVFNPRTQANFVWETPVDLTAEFTDISAGEGINFWEWNFNDGSEFAYEQHPVHTFPSSGEYTVILKISNGISTSTKYRSVRVP